MLLLLIVIGLASGMLSGMVGVGGGLIIVPALIFFLAFSQKEAQGTSLGILLLPVGILGVLQYYKQGYVCLDCHHPCHRRHRGPGCLGSWTGILPG